MNNAIFDFEHPANEPILDYAACSNERFELLDEIKNLSENEIEIPLIIGGEEIKTGITKQIVMPHNHKHVLATFHLADPKETQMAIDSALEAHKKWEATSWIERVSVTLKIADLVGGKYRHLINAATMVGQSKNIYQAEIDAACETVDFLRHNAHYLSKIYNTQPHSDPGVINRLEYRPLEGFVFAVSPFNFTSISANLALAPILMGNTVIWKPSDTALLSNFIFMQIFKEAGLPDGVLNFLPGDGPTVGDVVFNHPELAGVHFTGSTKTFDLFWKQIGENIGKRKYKSYPRIVGETGGKDFLFVHNSAGVDEVATAIVRGAFEYQGQKCSAASRAYIPASKWEAIKKRIGGMLSQITVGDVKDFSNFMNAVIDERAFDKIMGYINTAKESDQAKIIFGGTGDKSVGYFVQPTVIQVDDPHFVTMEEEIFGPVISVYVYEDDKFEETLEICDQTSPYALTGAIFARDRSALTYANDKLKYAAGNFYYNDKPTGAVVGQQPFGGSRASGTNDKAGGMLNLYRWANPRTIKENLVPPTDFRYPFMSTCNCEPKFTEISEN